MHDQHQSNENDSDGLSRIEYTVIEAKSLRQLIDQVNTIIAEGWIPKGGVSQGGDGYGYFQAMIRQPKSVRPTQI